MSRAYEQMQLELIALEFQRQGYEVHLESSVDASSARYDAVATRHSDRSLVVIELLNADRPPTEMRRRLEALESLARTHPHARVELRYIDPALPSWTLRRHLSDVPRTRGWGFLKLLTEPANSLESAIPATALLQWWSLHAAMLRSLAEEFDSSRPESVGILDLYNDLLASELLAAPEHKDDYIELDLFELYDAVLGALQGVAVTEYEVDQLRRHVRAVRSQIAGMIG